MNKIFHCLHVLFDTFLLYIVIEKLVMINTPDIRYKEYVMKYFGYEISVLR